VSPNPADFTPNVASATGATRAVYKFLQVGTTMYAGGAITSVSTGQGVTPRGTFTRSNLFAFNAATGAIKDGFNPALNGPGWWAASRTGRRADGGGSSRPPCV
jgi:hypothetical protein